MRLALGGICCRDTAQDARNAAIVQAIKDARESFLLRTELFEIMAQESKAKYDAFLAVGFSAEQALVLCRP